MRMLRRGAVSVIGMAALVGMLAGCESTSPAPDETSAVAPIETVVETAPELSDEEALQIAVETYEEYLAISGNLLNSKGESFEDLEAITTENMAENNAQSLELAQSNDYTTEGVMPVIKSELLRTESNRIDALVCVDYSQSQTFDENGSPVGEDRADLKEPFEISVVLGADNYKIDRSELWTQSDFCAD